MLNMTDLQEILCAPGHTGEIRLADDRTALLGAGFEVPVFNGIPDFITHAPSLRRTIECLVPNTSRPGPDVVKPLPRVKDLPAWFTESGWKYRPLQEHGKGWLLDIGAGHGNRGLYERMGYKYCGIDADPSGLNSHSWGRAQVELDLVADAHALPVKSESVQVINSTAVFEHLYNPALAAREIARVLVPGGILVGSCSFLEGEHFDSQHHMTALGVFRLFTEAGLEVVSLYPAASLWEMHAPNLYLGLPFSRQLARLHEWLYFRLVAMKSREPVLQRRMRLAAIIGFHAVKSAS